MKKLIPTLTVAAAAVLAGCTSFPVGFEATMSETRAPQEEALKELGDRWTATEPLTFVKSAAGVSVKHLGALPEALAQKQVQISFAKSAKISFADLAGALRVQGVNLVSRLESTSINDLALPDYKGSLKGLLEVLGQVHNVSYEYRNGVVFLQESGRYSVTLPQHEEFLKRAATGLSGLGATKTSYDLSAGKLFFEAKPDVIDAAEEYISAVGHNAAMVTLQVAVLTVGHNRDLSIGFDWAGLSSTLGAAAVAPGATAKALGGLAKVTGTGGGYTFTGRNFSLAAALNAMSKYGTARTEQNVTIGTLSGLPVKITSGNEIPYVKTIGSSIGAGGAISGSTATATIRSGLSLDVKPQYDNKDFSVVTEVKVDMSTLVGFRELSAGASLGTISQPEIQKITFENVGRMGAGDTLVVGGLSYDQLSDNYQGLPGLEDTGTAGRNRKMTRQTIYIVVRPTVVMFSPDAEKLTELLKERRAAEELKTAGAPVAVAPAVPQAAKVAVEEPKAVPPSVAARVSASPVLAPVIEESKPVAAPAAAVGGAPAAKGSASPLSKVAASVFVGARSAASGPAEGGKE